MVLATVLAAVADGGGPESSRTCSKFVSVNSSFEGVILAAGSEVAKSATGGVFGTSDVSFTATGGGSPGILVSSGTDVTAIVGSTGASWLGIARGAFCGGRAGAGLLNMLAQLRVPSGFEGGLASSTGGGWAASADIFSQDDSIGVLSAAGCSQLLVAASETGVSQSLFLAGTWSVLPALVLRTPLATEAPLPLRGAPLPRSEPRPRPPRAPSNPPLPRPPRVELETSAPDNGSLTFD